MLIKFVLSLPAPEQVIVSQEAQLIFLKNLDMMRSLLSTKDQGDQEEEEAYTVINGEDPRHNVGIHHINIPPEGQNYEVPEQKIWILHLHCL